jgi:hypothetical protein
MVDGPGPLPDSWMELGAWFVLAMLVALTFGIFTGLDSQVDYALTSTSTYFTLNSDVPSDAVVFSNESVDLMNEVSARSLGVNPVASERLYCGEIRNQQVVDFRLADTIDDSSLTSVSGSCIGDVDLWTHSQPDGTSSLSEEDKDLESTGAKYTCIQFEEISTSPFNNRLNGINCWEIIGDGAGFEPVPVFQG